MIVRCTSCKSAFAVDDSKVENKKFAFTCPKCATENIIDNKTKGPDRAEAPAIAETDIGETAAAFDDSSTNQALTVTATEEAVEMESPAEDIIDETMNEEMPSAEISDEDDFSAEIPIDDMDLEIDDSAFDKTGAEPGIPEASPAPEPEESFTGLGADIPDDLDFESPIMGEDDITAEIPAEKTLETAIDTGLDLDLETEMPDDLDVESSLIEEEDITAEVPAEETLETAIDTDLDLDLEASMETEIGELDIDLDTERPEPELEGMDDLDITVGDEVEASLEIEPDLEESLLEAEDLAPVKTLDESVLSIEEESDKAPEAMDMETGAVSYTHLRAHET